MSARVAALWLGALNLVLGLAGFFAPFVVGGSGGLLNVETGRLFAVLTTNWAHSGLHVALGIYGLASRGSMQRAQTYLIASVAIWGLLAALALLGHAGWLAVRGPAGDLAVLEIAVNGVATALHAALALAAALVVVLARRRMRERDGEEPAPVMMRAPLVLAMVMGGVMAIILLLVPMENLKVAPWAEHGVEGRLHFQMKNVTRLGGDTAAVREAVAAALSYDADGPRPAGGDWRAEVLAHTGWAASPSHVVALPSDGPDAPLWALPGAYWAAFAGAPVVFVGRDSIGKRAEESIRSLGLPVYLLAPAAAVSDEVLDRLAGAAPAVRVASGGLAEHATRLAEHRDEDTGFGWGRNADDDPTWYHFFMAAPQDAEAAYAALPLARTVAGSFLYADSAGGVPAATDRYWWSLRPDWAVTPSETAFRHLWIVGDRVSYGAQGRMDLAVEKAPYLSMGSVALSGLEGIGIVLIALGVAGFCFVLAHGSRRLAEVMPAMRVAWAFTALLFPVGGVLLYLAAYRRPRLDASDEMPKWLRPPAVGAAAATAMGFGYGAPLMIAVGWALAWYGFPLFFGAWADGWSFTLGAGMPLMMIAMYVGAVLLAWPFVQSGMMAMMRKTSRKQVAWRSLGVTSLSMLAVSLGMMSTSWFMMMERHPMMMPHEDEILWIVSLWVASMVGFLVAWPLNWPMVRGHLKSGGM